MSYQKTKVCSYCSAANSSDRVTCIACGAPLPAFQEIEPMETRQVRQHVSPAADEPSLDAVEIGKKVEEGSFKALRLYSDFYRALADAAAIAITSSAIGITGGVTEHRAWGVLLGTLLGLAVGLVKKSYLFTLLGAPLGFVGGALAGGLLWAGGLGPGWMVFGVGLGACAFALFGGRWIPLRMRGVWGKIRPFLGAAGGLAFAVLGTILGSAGVMIFK